MSTHSKAPWRRNTWHSGIVLDADGRSVCNVLGTPGDVALIEAAPELLAALRLAAVELDEAASELAFRGAQQGAENCAQRAIEARAAIAKATRETR